MRTARFLLALASLAALLVFAAPAWADTISVPADYKTIQEAVDAAARGDTVWVAAGVYEETVTIKQAMTLCGAGSDQTIIDGGGKGHVVQVVSDDDIYIRSLAVRNGSMDESYAGIDLYAAGGCVIEDCVATTTWAGIRFTYSHENTVRGCTFMDVEYGVDVGDRDSYGNMLVDCQAARCRVAAYNAYAGSNGLHVLRCTATDCGSGVVVGWSSGWVVECCTLSVCGSGIVLDTATGGTVRHNTVTDMLDNGMWIAGMGSSGNDIYSNLFARCVQRGIGLGSAATSNSIHDNRLEGCGIGAEIRFHASMPNEGNTFFRNAFVGNTVQAADASGYANAFHAAYPWGNYWDDATGVDEYGGPDQNIPGADGVFDEPYKLDDVVDQYPATTPDTEAPRTGIVSGPDGVWVSTPYVEFTWEGSDDRTPAEYLAFSWSLDDSPWALEGVTTTFFEELAEGEHTFAVMARDGMGLEDSTPASITFGVDLTAPLTEDSGDTAWHKTDTTVYFNAYDELSGVDYTEYSLNGGGSWTTGSEVTIPAPSDGSGDGVWNIVYRSVDLAGNVEATRGCSVKIAAGFGFDEEGAPVGEPGVRVNDLAVADFDGDGDQDVAVGCDLGAGPELTVYENDGTPFVGDWPIHAVGESVESIHSVEAADLDSDGDLDLVVGSGGAGTTAQIFAGQNDGTPFDGAWPWHPVGLVSSSAICHAEVALADVDGNGTMDVASATSAYAGIGSVIIWYNAAPWSGPWAQSVVFGGTSLGSIATGRFNGDERPDLAVSVSEGSLLLLINTGGSPGAGWGFSSLGSAGPGMVSDIAVADFDEDGYDDFATSIGYLPSTTQWVWVNQPSLFSWRGVAYADTPAAAVAMGDLDGNGYLDTFSGSHGSGPELLAHQASVDGLSFATSEVADLAASVRAVALADLDGDGDLDAVSGSDVSMQGEVLAWENLNTVDTADPWSWSDYDWSWKNTSFFLDLQADDTGSGVHHIEYKVGMRGEWQVAPAGVFRLGKRGWGSGQYEVYYRAVDNAGNVEGPNYLLVGIDGKPPRTTDDADDLWHGEDVTVTFDAKDDHSGVRYLRYSVDGGSWQNGGSVTIAALEDHSNDGVHEIRYYAVDWAGNRELTKTCRVLIDTAPPLVPLMTATKEVRPAAAGGPATRARVVARLRVDLRVADLASPDVSVVVRVYDAKGRVLDRVRLAGVEVGELTTLRFTGPAARLAASVRITVRDQAGFAGTRTVRL